MEKKIKDVEYFRFNMGILYDIYIRTRVRMNKKKVSFLAYYALGNIIHIYN